MRVVKEILSWAGVQASEPALFLLGRGFRVHLSRGKLRDSLHPSQILVNCARALGLELVEFSSVARSKVEDYLRDLAERKVPAGVRVGSTWGLAGEVSLDEMNKGPLKAWVYHVRRRSAHPPLEPLLKEALRDIAKSFLFPKNPKEGAKLERWLGDERPEGAEGHELLAQALEELSIPLSREFRELGELWLRSPAEALRAERELFRGLLTWSG